jgi:hypothetical protein
MKWHIHPLPEMIITARPEAGVITGIHVTDVTRQTYSTLFPAGQGLQRR